MATLAVCTVPHWRRRRTHDFGDLDPQYIPRDVGKADFGVCVVEPKSNAES